MILKEIYYIIENGLNILRIIFEKIMQRLNIILKDNSRIKTEIRDYLIYIGPFLISIIAFIIFCFLLSKIKEYKIAIQSVFFLISQKEIDTILIKINDFNNKNEQYQNKSERKIIPLFTDKSNKKTEKGKGSAVNNQTNKYINVVETYGVKEDKSYVKVQDRTESLSQIDHPVTDIGLLLNNQITKVPTQSN